MSKNRPLTVDSQPNSAVVLLTGLAMLLCVLAFVSSPWGRAQASTMERIWTDPVSGIALSGYDPLSYFVDGKPRLGRAEHEVTWGGVTWRFTNEGNAVVFRRDANVYAPQFGGHGVVSIAKGWPASGNPELWSLFDGKLYFFHSLEALETWKADRKRWTRQAASRWPQVQKQLSR